MTREEIHAVMHGTIDIADEAFERGLSEGARRAEVKAARLRVALAAYQSHMSDGQRLIVDYLEPRPDRLSGGQLIEKLIEHFDGPEQRRIDKLAEGLL